MSVQGATCKELLLHHVQVGKGHERRQEGTSRGVPDPSAFAPPQDALLVLLKSLTPACLFNIVGFGSTFKALFPASRSYCEVGDNPGEVLQGTGLSRLLALLLLWQESLAVACESLRRMRADMGSTNVLSPLRWVVRQPIPRGHPRLLFLLTAGAVGDTGKVLEVLRNHSSSTRYGAGRRAGKKPDSSRVGCSSSAGGPRVSVAQTSPRQESRQESGLLPATGETSKGLERIPEVQMLFKQSKAG